MRFFTAVLLACAFVAVACADTVAAPPASLDITANRVTFFSNRSIVTADGNVRVRLSDGAVVRGETFAMDLKLNRYIVAGDVHLDAGAVHDVGAAFAGYPDLDRSYFLPATSPPARWTFYGLDWSNDHAGREQPGDAFAIPDLTGERAYIIASGARIIFKTNVLFDNARIYTAGVYLPSPRYLVTFSTNSHFAENGFSGARGDVAVPFNGSEHSVTALHLRNDQFNGTYLALDQHFVWNQDWIVASVDPLTQEQRQYNFIGYKRFSPGLEGRLFLQESAAQAGIINRPDNAAGFAQLQLNAGLRRSGLSLTMDNYYQYLLGYRAPPDDRVATAAYDPRWREHPTDAQLSWTGYENRVLPASSKLLFRLRSGLGFAHDAYGEGGYPNEQPGPPDAAYHYAGGTLYTGAIPLGRYSFTASFDKQRTWFSLPHHVDATDARASLSRTFPLAHVASYLAYETRTTGDYWGAQQRAAYPAAADVIITPFGPYGGQSVFGGFATTRSLTGSIVYTPTRYFGLNLTAARFWDFPGPVPGVYGQPPVQISGDLRVRVSKQVLLDLSRSYYFNFANERWTPQFGIQISP